MDSFTGAVSKVLSTKAGHWLRKGREDGGPLFRRREWGSLGEGQAVGLIKGSALNDRAAKKAGERENGKRERIWEKGEALFNRALWKALWMPSVCLSHTGHRRKVLSTWKGGWCWIDSSPLQCDEETFLLLLKEVQGLNFKRGKGKKRRKKSEINRD